MSAITEKFIDGLQSQFPVLTRERVQPLISENLLSPFQIELPIAVLTQAQDFVEVCDQISESSSYLAMLGPELSARGLNDPGNKSILMSYDFHVAADGCLKLIEINTNASFLALGDLMYGAHGLAQPVGDFSMDEIRQNILEELRLWGRPTPTPRVAIVDENPSQQRLFIEFLVYEQWMKAWGFSAKICDIAENLADVDFIYNRYTDFYLEDPKSAALRKLFLEKSVCFSPNPFEYLRKADKQRLINLSDAAFVDQLGLSERSRRVLASSLPLSLDLGSDNKDEIWARRKDLFFKPKRSFGSKQSFKGASISRKAFEEILADGIVAQEYITAPERVFETPAGPQSFKFDLRFYTYRNRVQSVVARLYQGQVTNLRTPLGGFAPVIFKR